MNHEEWESFKRIVPPSWIRQINQHLYERVVRAHPIFEQHDEAIKELSLSM